MPIFPSIAAPGRYLSVSCSVGNTVAKPTLGLGRASENLYPGPMCRIVGSDAGKIQGTPAIGNAAVFNAELDFRLSSGMSFFAV